MHEVLRDAIGGVGVDDENGRHFNVLPRSRNRCRAEEERKNWPASLIGFQEEVKSDAVIELVSGIPLLSHMARLIRKQESHNWQHLNVQEGQQGTTK